MHVAPDIIPRENFGHSNDGWGLADCQARKLADRLAAALASGEAEQYAKAYAAHLDQLPDEPCAIGGGTRCPPIPVLRCACLPFRRKSCWQR